MGKRVLVVGGGFRSLIAAISYARKGFNVTVIEKDKKLGGFMSPIPWNNYWLDKGPQYYDNFSKEDFLFLETVIGKNILHDIDFKYSTYANGKKTNGYAIPDWRSYGVDFCSKVFREILEIVAVNKNLKSKSNCNLLQTLSSNYGPSLTKELEIICKKMLTINAEKLSTEALKMVTFGGRALLFDDQQSAVLKTSPILDNFIAGSKKSIGNEQLNLYPYRSNLETVRLAFEKVVEKEKINVFLQSSIQEVNFIKKNVTISGSEYFFDKIFFGIDGRETEKILFNTEELSTKTTSVPEIFHFIELKESHKSNSHYTMNYSKNHRTSRITNFYNYLGNDGQLVPILCAEEPISISDFNKRDKNTETSHIVDEICEINDFDPDCIKNKQSFFVETTYKVPNYGFEQAESNFKKRLKENYEDYCLVPSLTTLTRKQTLDDLRTFDLI